MSLAEIVNVQISIDNAAVQRASFGTMMFLGLHKAFAETNRTYSTVQGLLDDGFAATSQEVAVATAVFSQAVTPTQLIIGRRQTDTNVISVGTVADNTNYTVTIDGTPYTFDSGVAATNITIAAGLTALIDPADPTVDVTNNLDGTFDLNPTVASTAYAVSTTANLTQAPDVAGADTLTATISAIRQTNDVWYALTAHSHVVADVLEVAGVIETLKKIYLYSSSDADILTTAGTDIFTQLAALSYARTAGLYDPDADSAFPEAAWLGVMLPKDPGSATWAFKTLVGQDADPLTQTESTNARAITKNGNTYELIGGVSITRYGTVHEGEFLDVIRGVDWLESRMTERIFGKLVSVDKIPYTDSGVASIEAEVRAQLLEAIDQGVIAEDPSFVVVAPKVANVPPGDKIARRLPAITFSATLEGAIHAITVTGTVSV